jgi:hypothetical protein
MEKFNYDARITDDIESRERENSQSSYHVPIRW